MRGARHTKLREATASRHAVLDAHVNNSGYFRSRPAYGRYLQGLHAFHNTFDPEALRLAPDLLERWGVDKHASLLFRDISALELETASCAESQSSHFHLPNRSALVGALYVLIGSSLGARVLLPWAHKLQLPAPGGVLYLTHLAAARDWPSFIGFMEADVEIDETDLMHGARSTFDAVHHFLAKGAPA